MQTDLAQLWKCYDQTNVCARYLICRSPEKRFSKNGLNQSLHDQSLFLWNPFLYIWCPDQSLELKGYLLPEERTKDVDLCENHLKEGGGV